MNIQVGSTVGDYEVVAVLGVGGMGEVYRANDLTLGQPVALKFLPESTVGNEKMLARLHAEVRIARQASHPRCLGNLTDYPLTVDLSVWYAGYGIIPLVVILGPAIWAFRTALAGRPLFKEG